MKVLLRNILLFLFVVERMRFVSPTTSDVEIYFHGYTHPKCVNAEYRGEVADVEVTILTPPFIIF